MSESRAERARALRYKRGALASMGFEFLRVELDDISGHQKEILREREVVTLEQNPNAAVQKFQLR